MLYEKKTILLLKGRVGRNGTVGGVGYQHLRLKKQSTFGYCTKKNNKSPILGSNFK